MSAPSSLLQIQNAAKSFGSRVLFEDASFAVNEGEHIGVIGPNGAGKTTLFKALVGELEFDAGEVTRSRSLSLGYLQQHDQFDPNESVEDFLSHSRVMPIWDLKKLGSDLGLTQSQFASPVVSLSGGFRMRVKLLRLLGDQPNLMLLDEPTNYLDLETILVLQDFLQSFNGAFMLISHDREFLRKTTDHILEIEAGDFVKYNGNIDDYFEQKELLREQLEKQAQSAAAKRKVVLDFAARFGAKASKARQAQSRLKRLSKMETIELKPVQARARIKIPEPSQAGRLMVELDDIDMGYPEKTVLQRVEMKIERGDRIGIVGYNGQGKSTFLKTVAKEIKPLFGEVVWGYQVSASYYAQHVSERLLDDDNVVEAMAREADRSIQQQDILDMAGSLLFSGDDMKKKIRVLSGGEKARVALGQTLLRKAPLLVLDEPTNHLDFYTVEALTQALEKYPGSLVVVSHDRVFVKRISSKIVEIASGQARLYPGSYDEYVWRVERREEEELSPPPPRKDGGGKAAKISEPSKPVASRSKISKAEKKEIEKKRRALSKEIAAAEKKIKILESMLNELNQKLTQSSGSEAEKQSRELQATQSKIEELEARYLEMMESDESLAKELAEMKKN